MRSLPGSGLATARISNASVSPSLSIGVGQIVGRTVAPVRWSFVNTAVKVCAAGSTAMHLHVLLVGFPEGDVDELAHVQAEAVRAVRRDRDGLLRAAPCVTSCMSTMPKSLYGRRRVAGLPYPASTRQSYVFFQPSGSFCADAHVLQRFPRRAVVARELHEVRALAIRGRLLDVRIDAPDRRACRGRASE